MPHPLAAFARLHPLQRVAVALWAVLLVAVAGRVLAGPARSHTVVPIYLVAAERWANAEPLYASAPPLDVYRNPPGFAAALVPFTWMPERAAELLWRAVNVAALLVALGAWVRYGLPRPLTPGESGAVFALAVVPALPSVNNGQVNLLIIAALLLGATAAARLRGRAAGAWLALAAAIKVYPLAVGLLVAAGSPRRVLPWFAGACLAFAAFPFLFHAPGYVLDQHRAFVAEVSADDRTKALVGRAGLDAYFILRQWAEPPPRELYRAVQLAVAAGMAGLVVVAARRTGNPREVAPLALHLGCAWATVFGPATEVHTYVLLGPTAAALIVLARGDRHRGRLALAAVGYALLVAPVVRDSFPNGKAFHGLALQPVGGLLVLAAAAWAGLALVRRAPAAAPPIHHGERRPPCRTGHASPLPARA